MAAVPRMRRPGKIKRYRAQRKAKLFKVTSVGVRAFRLRASARNLRKGKFKSSSMDMTWLTDRIAVGGGIWNAERMAEVSGAGVTHIINMQIEFDDMPLARPHGIAVLWNAIDDDFQPKPVEVFERGVEFGQSALEEEESKLFIHCAAGVHRAPMMALALLCSLDWDLEEAMELIETKRPEAEFLQVYVNSVRAYLRLQNSTRK